MITLLLSILITVADYQKYLAIITLLIDIVSSIILLWRVIKSRKISDDTLKKIAQKGKLNKRNLLSIVSELILKLEKFEDVSKDNEEKEVTERQENEVSENDTH